MKIISLNNPIALLRLRTLLASLVLAGLLASCSSKGVHMPKHRKRRNCDCPTFSLTIPTSQPHADGPIYS